MRNQIILFLLCLTSFCYGQGFNLTPAGGIERDTLIIEAECLDTFLYTGAVDYVRFNTGPKDITDAGQFDNFCELFPAVRFAYFYDHIWSGGTTSVPSVCAEYWYHYRNTFPSGFPDAEPGAVTQFLLFDQTNPTVPVTLPGTWVNFTNLRFIYLRRNGYTTADVDSLITQYESLANSGMGSSYTGTHRLYLNQTGGNQNATPTITTHTGNGWALAGTNRLTKTILGKTHEIYFNP